ncbi:hypothetical protein ACLEPN_20160 [Myxococcus sp. 1LA]
MLKPLSRGVIFPDTGGTNRTHCATESTSSFWMTRARCTWMVFSVVPRRWAASLLFSP